MAHSRKVHCILVQTPSWLSLVRNSPPSGWISDLGSVLLISCPFDLQPLRPMWKGKRLQESHPGYCRHPSEWHSLRARQTSSLSNLIGRESGKQERPYIHWHIPSFCQKKPRPKMVPWLHYDHCVNFDSTTVRRLIGWLIGWTWHIMVFETFHDWSWAFRHSFLQLPAWKQVTQQIRTVYSVSCAHLFWYPCSCCSLLMCTSLPPLYLLVLSDLTKLFSSWKPISIWSSFHKLG